MRRVKYKEDRVISGRDIIIWSMIRMGYNGEWIDDGFDVWIKGGDKQIHFIGYPSDSDIEERFGLTDSKQ